MAVTRRVLRGRRTAPAPELGSDWVRPAWLERQGARDLGGRANTSGRSWTVIGTLASPRRAIVDRAGLITPRLGGFSVDWWIGAEDRWHYPSREATLRQSLVGTAPVVETRLRVPGGDAVARAYAVVAGSDLGELIILEVENRSATPVALAIAVRPYDVNAVTGIRRVEVEDGRILVDGDDAVLLPRPPSSAVASSLADGDVAARLTAQADGPRVATCERGLAHAAVVYPLAHRAMLRVGIPLGPAPRGVRRVLPSPLPEAASAARAWAAQTARGMQADLPTGRLPDAFGANRGFVLQTFNGHDLDDGVGVGLGPLDTAVVVAALGRLGFASEARASLLALPEQQRFDGSFESARPDELGRLVPTAAAVWAITDQWRLTRDLDAVRSVLPTLGLAARWVARRRKRAGDGVGAWLTTGALHDAAAVLRAAGEEAAADECDRAAAGSALEAADGRQWGAVPTLPFVRVPSAVLSQGVAVKTDAGLSPRATAQQAAFELAIGDHRGLARLRWLVETASPTFTWPEAIDPATRGGVAGLGHDPVAGAWFAIAMRNLLVCESDDGLVLFQTLPEEWVGEPIEVHQAPTAHGLISFALRWHGERPALLWDLDRPAGAAPVGIRVGVAPGWVTHGARGESMLVDA